MRKLTRVHTLVSCTEFIGTWESYNKYSHEDTEILIEVQPKYVEVWDTSDDGYAFQLFIDFENKTVEPKIYEKNNFFKKSY